MSYARWSNSYWYAYWDVCSDKDILDEQVLTIHLAMTKNGTVQYKYSEIKDGKDLLMKDIRNLFSTFELKPESMPTEDDYKELSDIFDEFTADMENEFPGQMKGRKLKAIIDDLNSEKE